MAIARFLNVLDMKVKGFKGVLQKLAVAPCDMQRVDAVGYDSRSTVGAS